MLIPDKIDADAAGGKQRFGVFGTTVVAFFLAEMGDKTQIATVALAARYADIVQVVLGTTFGMMLANVPAVLLGDRIAAKVSMRLVHGIAAVIFAILGVLTLLQRRQAVLKAAMLADDLAEWRHDHVFDSGNAAGERGVRAVMWITAAMMLVEIAADWFFHSMALLADGFHMSSYAVAIGLSAFAYATARSHAKDPRFAFGTWKMEVLGGFASAIFLLVVVALMAYGSIERLITPEAIHYPEAMTIAVLGLAVNLVSARILGKAHYHDHGHDHDAHSPETGHHHDLNLKSAYLHVVADAATSVAAIAALAGGWWLGWAWLDPAMGLIGAVIVAVWAKGLIGETSKVLLDKEMDHPVVDEIRAVIAEHGAGQRDRDHRPACLARRPRQLFLRPQRRHPRRTTSRPARCASGWPIEEIAHATIEVQMCHRS